MPEQKAIKSPQTIITTHLNADFDAVASAVAASKLFPESVIVLPGSQEKAVRNYLKSIETPLAHFASLKDINLAKLRNLVIVDANQKSRLGNVAELLSLPGARIYLFDHHQEQECDIRAYRKIFSD